MGKNKKTAQQLLSLKWNIGLNIMGKYKQTPQQLLNLN